MRVVIADDHPIILMGLRILLQNDCADCQLIGEARSGEELLALLARQECDLAITDFSMSVDGDTVDGLEMIRQLRKHCPRLGIIVLTMLHNPALIKGIQNAGAQAVVEKTSMTKELTLAVQMVRSGRSYLSEYLRKRLAEGRAETATQRPADKPAGLLLSVREAEIMRMLARGMTVTEIAKATCRSIKTISQQKHDAMRKLCIDSDNQLFEYIRIHGL
jgi:two-component system capsular synthesis response regulator RcsB